MSARVTYRLTDEERAALARVVVERGARDTATGLRIGQQPLYRAVAGEPVGEWTLHQIRHFLKRRGQLAVNAPSGARKETP